MHSGQIFDYSMYGGGDGSITPNNLTERVSIPTGLMVIFYGADFLKIL
jgi:hypothetical protein